MLAACWSESHGEPSCPLAIGGESMPERSTISITGWIYEINSVLNGGMLPKGLYAMAEHHAGQAIADVLDLYSGK
jgi:hypothetical protein